MMKGALKCAGFGVLVVFVAAGCGADSRRQELERLTCENNLKVIGIGLAMWAGEHEDALPATLSELYPDYVRDVSVFVCLSTKHMPGSPDAIDQWTDYVYVKGLRWILQPQEGTTPALVVYDKPGNHGGGRNELYTDFTVKWKAAAE